MNSKNYKIPHNKVGSEVWYKGKIWRIISAHKNPKQDSPWFTLKRELGIEIVAKENEVTIVLN